jgi:hypothetical protein
MLFASWVNDLMSQLMRFVNGLDRNDYLLLAGITIAIGFFCLKGFGSRSDY